MHNPDSVEKHYKMIKLQRGVQNRAEKGMIKSCKSLTHQVMYNWFRITKFTHVSLDCTMGRLWEKLGFFEIYKRSDERNAAFIFLILCYNVLFNVHFK